MKLLIIFSLIFIYYANAMISSSVSETNSFFRVDNETLGQLHNTSSIDLDHLNNTADFNSTYVPLKLKMSPKAAAIIILSSGIVGGTVMSSQAGFSNIILQSSYFSWLQQALPFIVSGSFFSTLQTIVMGGVPTTMVLSETFVNAIGGTKMALKFVETIEGFSDMVESIQANTVSSYILEVVYEIVRDSIAFVNKSILATYNSTMNATLSESQSSRLFSVLNDYISILVRRLSDMNIESSTKEAFKTAYVSAAESIRNFNAGNSSSYGESLKSMTGDFNVSESVIAILSSLNMTFTDHLSSANVTDFIKDTVYKTIDYSFNATADLANSASETVRNLIDEYKIQDSVSQSVDLVMKRSAEVLTSTASKLKQVNSEYKISESVSQFVDETINKSNEIFASAASTLKALDNDFNITETTTASIISALTRTSTTISKSVNRALHYLESWQSKKDEF